MKDELAAVMANYFFAGMETFSYGFDEEDEGPAGDQWVTASSIIAERPTNLR